MPDPQAASPAQSLAVFRAAQFRAVDGANLGDPLSFAAELELNDAYALASGADTARLSLAAVADGQFRIAPDSALGRPGAALHLDCVLHLMSPEGAASDAIVLVETDDRDHVADVYLLPLATLVPRAPYALVGIDRAAAATTLAHLACARFTRGTHITLASGAQRRIEDLAIGDRVLTRDDGPRTLRWIGRSTLRATGDFAPIRIAAGALNNAHDLVVSPDHRLFIYQRTDRIGAGRSDLLVKARHLVNGDTITVERGGFVDYFQLLFDRHHIVYAEGIAAESMLIDTRTRPVVPHEVTRRLSDGIAAHGATTFSGIDVQGSLLNRPNAAELLRRASRK